MKHQSILNININKYKKTIAMVGINLQLMKFRISSIFFLSELKHIIFYVSALQITPYTVLHQQKRFRAKINIQKPRQPHYFRTRVNEFLTPFYPNPDKGKKLMEVCLNARKIVRSQEDMYNPYERIIANEVRNWYDNSKMIAICHRNSMTREDEFEFAVPLRKANMYYKRYNKKIMKLALQDSPYAVTQPLYTSQFCLVFGADINVAAFEKIAKKIPQVILIGKQSFFDFRIYYGYKD